MGVQADTLDVESAAAAVPVSRGVTLLRRLDDMSDRLSPIVVKEVRQIVRGREFNYSFLATLVVGLIIAFFGAANASAGSGTTGQGVFSALMACLTLLGAVVVPIGAFSALRNERLEQTMDLITVTSLSARKVVIGKLLAQAVKLLTLFAGVAPFVAMSFLLGGIDFVTIIVSLAAAFFGSLWVCAAALLASSLAKSRAMSGFVLAAGGIILLGFLGVLPIVSVLRFALIGGFTAPGPAFSVSAGTFSASSWWGFGTFMFIGGVTLVNLLLLAENRLSSPVDNKATALRVGFLVQLVAIVGAFVAVSWFAPGLPRPVEPMMALGIVHLAAVAAFVVTEDFDVSRRVERQMRTPRWWRPLGVVLGPGARPGVLYVFAQMAILAAATWYLASSPVDVHLVLAACGYICFFSGVPAVVLRSLRRGISSFLVRIAILVLLSASLVLPDVLYYLLARPETFSLTYTTRHLLNPARTLVNWNYVEAQSLYAVPMAIGAIGLLSYFALLVMSTRREPNADRPVSIRGA